MLRDPKRIRIQELARQMAHEDDLKEFDSLVAEMSAILAEYYGEPKSRPLKKPEKLIPPQKA